MSEARRWLATSADEFSVPETEFLAASIAAEDERIARDRAQQEKLRRLARSLAVGAAVASVLALIAVGMGGYAVMKRNEVERQRNEVSKANVGLKAARDEAERQRKRSARPMSA